MTRAVFLVVLAGLIVALMVGDPGRIDRRRGGPRTRISRRTGVPVPGDVEPGVFP